jgi:hypothetical protein
MYNEILRWSALEAQLARYREFYREAEEERLVRQALAGQYKTAIILSQSLTWLGHHLLDWGCALQKRYGASLQADDLQIENLVCSK